MVSPTDQGMTAIEKLVCCSQLHSAESHCEALGWVRRQREGENVGKNPFIRAAATHLKEVDV